MIKKIENYLKKQSFQPNLLSIVINPFYFIRLSLYRGIKRLAPQLKGKLMDFGSGRKPYKSLFEVTEYIGVDLEKTGHDHSLSDIDVFYDGKTIPFDDNYFDSIFCSEVMEHVFEPDMIFAELFRTLKPGGKLLLTVPFCWNEHEVPFDYGRYTSFGITHLLEKHNFRVLYLGKTGNFARVIFQLWALYFYELFKRWGMIGKLISLILIAPINLLGVIILPLFPVNRTTYFNNIVLAEKQS